MAPELKKWLHRRMTKRKWKKLFKSGDIVPHMAIEEYPKLKRLIRPSNYLLHLDGYRMERK